MNSRNTIHLQNYIVENFSFNRSNRNLAPQLSDFVKFEEPDFDSVATINSLADKVREYWYRANTRPTHEPDWDNFEEPDFDSVAIINSLANKARENWYRANTRPTQEPDFDSVDIINSLANKAREDWYRVNTSATQEPDFDSIATINSLANSSEFKGNVIPFKQK